MVELATESSGEIIGEWVTPSISYVEPLRIYCAFCGRPIAHQFWRAAPEGKLLSFCDPGHAELYTSYWLSTYGANGSGGGKEAGLA
jgi:hypothetical protein